MLWQSSETDKGHYEELSRFGDAIASGGVVADFVRRAHRNQRRRASRRGSAVRAVRRRRKPDVRVLYADALGRIGPLDDPRLDSMTRAPPDSASAAAASEPGDALAALARDQEPGPACSRSRRDARTVAQLSLLRRGLDLRRRVWLYWPAEGAAEVGTYERLASYRRHRDVIRFYERAGRRRCSI